MFPESPRQDRGGPGLLWVILGAVVFSIAQIVCSETSRPVAEEPGTPPGMIRGSIRLDRAVPFSFEELTVHTLLDSTGVSADGRFLAVCDTTLAEQPLLITMRTGAPILICFFAPTDEELIVDAGSTVRTLLSFDPAFALIRREERDRVIAALDEEVAGIVDAVETRLAEGRLRYLIDEGDREVQRRIAALLRAPGRGLSTLVGGADSTDSGGVDPPWLESGRPEEAGAVIVNPSAADYAIELADYYSGSRGERPVARRGELSGPFDAASPARTIISPPSDRYLLRFRSGRSGSPAEPDSLDFIPFSTNLSAACASYAIDILHTGSLEPWISDPSVFPVSELDGVSGIAEALDAQDPVSFSLAVSGLVIDNHKLLLPHASSSFTRRIDQLARCYISATEGMKSGRFVHDLLFTPDQLDRYVRIDGTMGQEIDPPWTICPATGLTAELSGDSVQVAWNDQANNEDGYLLQRRDNGIVWDYAWLDEDAERFTDLYCLSGKEYAYSVKAYTQVAYSAPSNVAVVAIPGAADTIPPAAVTDLETDWWGIGVNHVNLNWTAPGDDGAVGRASAYDLRYSEELLSEENWSSAQVVGNLSTPGEAGYPEFTTVSPLASGTTYTFAVKAVDGDENWSEISNIVTATTADDPNLGWQAGFEPYPYGFGVDGSIDAMVVFNGALIAGGGFTAAGGVSVGHIASWDGGQWHPLGSGLNGHVRALTVHDGDLYVGGSFTEADGVDAPNVARWDGEAWTGLRGGTSAGVRALISYDGALYVGGSFAEAGGAACAGIARWDGSSWSPVGSGVDNQVFVFGVYEEDLIVGGDFGSAGGVPGTSEIALWNGAAWHPLGTGMDRDYVHGLGVHDGDLYAGGQFLHAGGIEARNIARWDGAHWHPLGSGIDYWVRELVIYQGDLIAGGDFARVGGVWFGYVARWSGGEWQPLGSGLDGAVRSMQVTGSGLFVGGWFRQAGVGPSDHIALWSD